MIGGPIPEIGSPSKKKRHSIGSDDGPSQGGCFSMCLGPSPKKAKKAVKLNKKQQVQARWQNQIVGKMETIFKENNSECVPEWLSAFQATFARRRDAILQHGFEFQNAFINLVKKQAKKRDSKEGYNVYK